HSALGAARQGGIPPASRSRLDARPGRAAAREPLSAPQEASPKKAARSKPREESEQAEEAERRSRRIRLARYLPHVQSAENEVLRRGHVSPRPARGIARCGKGAARYPVACSPFASSHGTR